MSYDLMVFELGAPPADRAGFMAWYQAQTEWAEDHGYDDPEVSTPALRAWFLEMVEEYPAMNGPLATDDVDDPRVTDYSAGRQVIYAAFAWSQADDAREAMFRLAKKHGIGFFDVSADDGGVWIPSPSGSYDRVHGE